MFLILPISLIVFSALGIFAVIYRKKNYLNKLYSLNTAGNDPDAEFLVGSNLNWMSYGADFFPEIAALVNRLKLNQHKAMWLMEAEKVLRRFRLVFLKVERLSDSWIRRIRKIHLNDRIGEIVQESDQPKEVLSTATVEAVSDMRKDEKISPAFLKNEEERLIIEIAKNPKDAKLYEALGDLYIDMENFVDAKESYEAAIELNPNEESLKVKLSSALEKLSSKN